MTKKHIAGGGILVAVAILLGTLFGGSSQPVPSDEGNVGGQRAGIQEFVDGIKPGNVTIKTFSATMPAQANEVAIYTNRSGHDVFILNASADIRTGSTASSTSKVSVFATTSSATAVPVWADFGTLAEGKRAMIQAVGIATSSTATTTNSVLAAVQAKGVGSVLVPHGSTVFGFLQQDTTGCSIAGAAAGVCETATSTNRGFNPWFRITVQSYETSI